MPLAADNKAAPSAAAKTPIDIGPLARKVGYALRRAQLVVFDEFSAIFAELDLRPAQYAVLVLLDYTPGLKQSEVASALGIQRANFVALFDSLERRGLACRNPAPNDRRSYALYLTESGKDVLLRANRLEAGQETQIDARLGPGGREALLGLLWQVAERG